MQENLIIGEIRVKYLIGDATSENYLSKEDLKVTQIVGMEYVTQKDFDKLWQSVALTDTSEWQPGRVYSLKFRRAVSGDKSLSDVYLFELLEFSKIEL